MADRYVARCARCDRTPTFLLRSDRDAWAALHAHDHTHVVVTWEQKYRPEETP